MRRNIEIYGDFKLCPIFMCKAVKQYEEYACLFKAVHFLQRRKGGWGGGSLGRRYMFHQSLTH